MQVAARTGWLFAALLASALVLVILAVPAEQPREAAQPLAFRIEFVEERIQISVQLDEFYPLLDVAAAPPMKSATRQ